MSAEADIYAAVHVSRDLRRRSGAELLACSLGDPAGNRPRRPGWPESDTRAAQERSAVPQRRVLVADDEPAVRLLLRVNLRSAGYEVVEATDGETALSSIRQQDFDLLLLDVMMPRMSGFELAERLRADPATAELPIVFVSARADADDVQRGFDLGAVDYVTKPFDPLLLGEHLNSLLDRTSRGDTARANRSKLLDDNPERER